MINNAEQMKSFYPKAMDTNALETLVRQAVQEPKIKDVYAIVDAYLQKRCVELRQQIEEAGQGLKQSQFSTIPALDNMTRPLELAYLQQQLEVLPDVVLREAKIAIEPKLESYQKAQLALLNFKAIHNLKRDFKEPPVYRAICLKVMAVILESKANSLLLAGLVAYSSESLIFAVVLSIMNLGAGSLGGYVLQGIRHVDASYRRKAWVISSLIFIVQGALIYLVTLMIQQTQDNQFEPEMALKVLFQHGFTWPWDLSLDALRFLALTLIFAVMGAYLVYGGHYADPYPGYARVSREAKQAKIDVEATLKTWTETLEQSVTLSLPEWDAQLSNLQTQQYQLISDQKAVLEMVNAMNDLIKAHLENYQQQSSWLAERLNHLTKDRQRSPYHPVESPILLNPFQTELATIETSVQQFNAMMEHLIAETKRQSVQLQQRFYQSRRQYLALVERRFQHSQAGRIEDQQDSSNDPPNNTPNTNFWGG